MRPNRRGLDDTEVRHSTLGKLGPAVVTYHILVVAALAGLLLLNGCSVLRPIPTERIQSGHLEEVLPSSTRVRVGLRSGDEIIGRVQSSTDSTLTLVRDSLELAGHKSIVVIPINEIDAINVNVTNRFAGALGFLTVAAIVALIALSLSWDVSIQ